MSWWLAGASLLGVAMNVRRDRRCFALWCGSSLTWAVVDLRAGLPAQAALMAVYAALAVVGWFAWKPEVAHGRDG